MFGTVRLYLAARGASGGPNVVISKANALPRLLLLDYLQNELSDLLVERQEERGEQCRMAVAINRQRNWEF